METFNHADLKETYAVWKNFSESFAIVLCDNLPNLPPNEKQRCTATLCDIFQTYKLHCEHLIPANKNCEITLKHYIYFDSWLFGQFVGVFLSEHYENQKNESLEAQFALLRFIGESNPFIFNSLMCLYLKMLHHLCDTITEESAIENEAFNWFESVADEPVSLNNVTFDMQNCDRGETVNLILRIFLSQMPLVCNLCAASLSILWHCGVILLRTDDVDKSMCYRLLALLIKDDNLPDHELAYDPTLGELFLQILNEIGKLCQVGKLRYEEDFCSLLSTLCEYLRSDTCYDFSYINSVYCLIFQCQIPLNETTEEVVLKFYTKLLRLSPSETDVLNLSAECCLQSINISLFAIALRNSIEKQFEQMSDTSNVDIYQSNKNWRSLITQTNKYIQEIDYKLNTCSSKQIVAVFKSVRIITEGAIIISHRFKLNFIFFGDEIYFVVNQLVKIFEKYSTLTAKILRIFMDIIKDVLMLPEIQRGDETRRNSLLAFLTLHLNAFKLSNKIPSNVLGKINELMDDEMKTYCITSLMWIPLASSYKYILFDEIFAASDPRVFQNFAVFIYNLTDNELNYFESYLFNSESEFLIKLSPFIGDIVCALDGHCVLNKSPDDDIIQLFCHTCDSEEVIERVNPVSDFRRAIINRLICLIMTTSNEAKLNTLSNAVKIWNHISQNNSDEFLSLLHDCFRSSDNKIVEKIVQITPHILFKNLLDSCDLEYSSDVLNTREFDRYIKSLHEVLVRAVINQDSIIQYTCIKAVGKIGQVPIEKVLYPCINLLMTPLILAPSRSSPLAKSTIEQIARVHDQPEELIYLKYRDNIFELITHLIVMNFSYYNTDLCNLHFDYTTVFCPATQPYILKYLLPYAIYYPEVRRIIGELAEMCDISVGDMLCKGFRQIFVHVLLFKEQDEAIKMLELFEQQTGKKIVDLLSNYVTMVLADFLIHYEEKQDKVKWAISTVRQLLNGTALKDIASSSQSEHKVIVLFVQKRFFGILMFLYKQINSNCIPDKTRRQIISSLKQIIELMEVDYLTSVRFKVLFTLRTITSSEKCKSPLQCVQLWDTFVKRIDKKILGPILSTIFVSLMPLRDHRADSVNDIFRYLVVDNGLQVKNHLHELYFVKSTQCDGRTYDAIRDSERSIGMTLEEKLTWLTQLVQHEIVEVKLHALKRLKDELSNHHKEISRLILASDSVDSLIPKILRVLIEGFRNPDEHIQLSSGICLGEFAAIDPSYIPNTLIKGDDAKKYTCYDIESPEFVIDTLKVLSRGFQMAKNNAIMDTFALAIQTTLKTYKMSETAECKYWTKIPQNLREIIQPFFTTAYILNDAESTYNIPHLIYSTENCTSVQKWAYGWSYFLISLLERDTTETKIFPYFKSVISYDNECMLFFLPHILLNAVLSASEANLAKIHEEMIAVIRDDRRGPVHAKECSSTQLAITEELQDLRNVEQSMDLVCAKTVFHLLDVLNKKSRDMRASSRGKLTDVFRKLSNFLGKFSPCLLAEKSFERKDYARSLLYMEELLCRNENAADLMDKYLATLAKTYVKLNDVDNVKGLFAKHSIKLRQPQHVIMLHEITDQFQDAAICYQQLLKDSDEERSLVYEKSMIRGYLSMNQPEMALRFVNSLTASKPDVTFYDDMKCEALWNTGRYEELAKVTSKDAAKSNDSWGVRIGQAVVHFLNHQPDSLHDELDRIRKTLTKSLHLSSSAYGGYKECYDVVIKLHILNEFEKVSDLVFEMVNPDTPHERRVHFESLLKTEFEERLNKLQPVSRVLQPVLNIRQTLFSVGRHLSSERPELVAMFNEEIRKCWLKVIEIANRTRNFQLAYSNILAIDNYQLKGFFIEKAKYYWEKSEQREALRTLQHGLEYHYKNFIELTRHKTSENAEDRIICSEANLLIGTYNDAMVNTDLDTNLVYFQNAAKLFPQSEKILVKLAQYYDKITSSVPAEELYRTRSHQYVSTIQCYGLSLNFGCEFIYQSLSRMINVWLDYATAMKDDKERRKEIQDDRRKSFLEMNKHISSVIDRLPAYYFCTSFSLIMSRISHPIAQCFEILYTIIIKCLLAYPNQILWQFMSLHKAKNKLLSDRVQKILKSSQLKELTPMITKFQQLFEQFSALCLASRSGNHASGATLLRNLTKNTSLLNSAQFNDILIPAQKFLTIVLPRSAKDSAQQAAYNPYPETMVYISRIRDEVHVYSSLQKPIRVNLVGTDGRDYPMIFKAYDDMRIDCRCMEFNSVVNMYLKRDVEARDRALRIRTYTVLPLLEKCGIIEFIPNLLSMRAVNMQMRRSYGLPVISVKQYESQLRDSMEKKKEKFRKLVSMHPPLLHEWFKQEFPNPSSWYAARTSYIRSLAVMSIVGYTLGLGDRHNDNILLDSNNGDVIHVDLNVIFNKGELLQWPECVPFRLTHSMIKAMGPLGYEGSFSCTSEIVNRILRERKEQLISILHMFLYDPPELSNDRSERNVDFTPENNIKKVQLRLDGRVTSYQKPPSIPLSVEGQTRKLIEEATDEDNLCRMFIGWSAFI